MQQAGDCIEADFADGLIAQLCCFPSGDADWSLIALLRSAKVTVTLNRLIAAHEKRIAAWNQDIFRSLCDAQSIGDWGHACWNPIVGPIQDSMVQGALPTEASMVGFSLMLAQAGVASQWRVRPKSPFNAAFGYRWFRCEESIELCSDGHELEIKIDSAPYRFRRRVQSWQTAEDNADAASVCTLPLVLSSPTSDVQDILADWPQSGVGAASTDDSLAVQAASSQLETYAAEYAAWIRHGVSIVVILDPRGPTLVGGSSASRPGLIVASKADPAELVEALVHEATHQYMFTLTILDELHDGSDTRQYFSPLRREMRPFGGILAAYHVLCNLLVLYEGLASSACPDRREYTERLESARAGLRAIDSVVHENPSLTELGTTFCRILHKRVEHSLA